MKLMSDEDQGPETDVDLVVARAIAHDLPASNASLKALKRIGAAARRKGYKASWSQSGGWVVQPPSDTRETEEPTG